MEQDLANLRRVGPRSSFHFRSSKGNAEMDGERGLPEHDQEQSRLSSLPQGDRANLEILPALWT